MTLETLADGTAIRLRPVRPEDEALLRDLVAHMTLQDRRFRFFMTMKELSPQLAARLSHVDETRELALIALAADAPTALGVARYAVEPGTRRAEFAIAVRSDWKAHGLGHLMMARLIAAARGRGIGALFGDVLRDNATMLQFCRELGFAVGRHPDDPAALRVTLDLAAEAPEASS